MDGTSASQDERRRAFATFLRSRRERLAPSEVGLPNGFRRRTSGLRREEVAQLAGVGVTWYTWLEQGRRVSPSAEVLDALVNNAGIGTSGARRELSVEGFELRFAVNYLAGFLLTRLLLPALEGRASSRIVNVASAGQQPIDFTDVMLAHGYSGPRAYRQSKLAQILFTFDLARELAGRKVLVNCLHPATFMDTTMVRLSGARPISTVEEGGAAILQLVMSPSLEGASGLYFSGMRESRADPQAYDPAARQKLRALSFDLVGLADPLERRI